MKITKPSVTIIKDKPAITILKNIERCGRLCYKSEHKITADSYKGFIKGLIVRNHLAVIEHESITAFVICDRGVSHEIVRHRIGSYCQESTRYISYKEGIEVIEPCFWSSDWRDSAEGSVPMDDRYAMWEAAMQDCEDCYRYLIDKGATPQEARSVLPNSLKTEIAITYNLREWRHFFETRCSKYAHPQIREVANMLLKGMKEYLPEIFGDING